MFAASQRERLPFTPLLVLALVASIFASLVGFTPTAQAAGSNYYVDSINGNDGNAGTSASSPWRSLAKINARSFGPGDVINLARGSSWTGPGGTSNALEIKGGGAEGSPITVQPYGSGAAPIIRNPSGSNSRGVLVQASWVVVQGLLVRESREAGVYLAADHAVVKNNEITQSGAGVQVQSQYNLITGNSIHDLTMVVNTPGGDDDYGATAILLKASNNEVSHNSFVNCKTQSHDYGTDGGGVELFGKVDNTKIHHNYANNVNGFSEAGGGSAHNVQVAFNTILNSGTAIGLHNGGSFHSDISNFRFENNTVVDTTGDGYAFFYMDGDPGNPGAFVVRNNILYATGFQIVMQGSTNFTHDNNIYHFTNGKGPNYGLGAGEKTGDPGFADMGKGNFSLKAGSPANGNGAKMGAH